MKITILENRDLYFECEDIEMMHQIHTLKFQEYVIDEIYEQDFYFIDGGDGWTRITLGGPEVWLLDGYGLDIISDLRKNWNAIAKLSPMSLEEYEVDEYGEIIK